MDNTQDTTTTEVENQQETMTTETPVTEVVVETASEAQTTSDLPDSTEAIGSGNNAMSRLELESVITRFLDDLEKLKGTMRAQKEMYDASFENDAEYSEKAEAEKEIKKQVSAIKQRIVKDPAVVVIEDRMKQIKDDIKDTQEAISRFAEQYVELTGTRQLMREDGEVLEIIRNYKLVKQKKD